MLRPGVACATGIELDRIKCEKAHAFLAQTLAEMRRRKHADLEPPTIVNAPIEEVLQVTAPSLLACFASAPWLSGLRFACQIAAVARGSQRTFTQLVKGILHVLLCLSG